MEPIRIIESKTGIEFALKCTSATEAAIRYARATDILDDKRPRRRTLTASIGRMSVTIRLKPTADKSDYCQA